MADKETEYPRSSGATTSAGGTSATTAAARWATGRRTSTASPTKASPSPTTTAQQSCTAGRAAFITGQNPIRTGLTKVGMPGADVGLQAEDPTIAELLKPLGYATGQFGKNHLGDRDEFLPTVHGFDEFFGNLYHLNAEEEPENARLSQGSGVQEAVRSARRPALLVATARAGRRIEDTGPLTKKRMETIDDEMTEHALGFIDETHAKAGQAVLRLVQHDGHALPDPLRREAQGQERPGRLQRCHGRA